MPIKNPFSGYTIILSCDIDEPLGGHCIINTFPVSTKKAAYDALQIVADHSVDEVIKGYRWFCCEMEFAGRVDIVLDNYRLTVLRNDPIYSFGDQVGSHGIPLVDPPAIFL